MKVPQQQSCSRFSVFFTKFLVSLPGSNNSNISNNGVTRVVVDIFTKYNNNGNNTTKTHRPLVQPILGLGDVIPKFSSVTTLFPSVSVTFWCSTFMGVMVVFIPAITYFRWRIFGNVSVVFIPAFFHFCIHFQMANFQCIKIDLHPFIVKSSL